MLKKINYSEYAVPFLCALTLIIHCILTSQQKSMWLDEIVTYYPASMPNFQQMLSFINDKINCGSYFYFILIWFWAKLFSASELSLRLFSSLGFCVAMTVTWSMLKQIHGFWSASLSTLVIFLGSDLILFQNSEARFYGLLLALSAILCKLLVETSECMNFDLWIALRLALLNGLLPLSHPFGFLYSCIFISVSLLNDCRRGFLRPWYYFCSLAGWSLFIPFIPAFLKQQELSMPHFWILKPNLQDLVLIYIGDQNFCKVILLLTFVLTLTFWGIKKRKQIKDTLLLFLGFSFIIFPLIIWIESQISVSLFKDRYMIIFQLGLTILSSAFFARILPQENNFTLFQKIILIFTTIAVLFLPFKEIIGNLHAASFQKVGPILKLDKNTTFITDDSNIYTQEFYYGARNCYFVLDWDAALDPENVPNATQDFQSMQALKAHLPDQNILKTEEILEKFPSFVFLGRSPAWIKVRMNQNTLYNIKEVDKNICLIVSVRPIHL